MFCFSEIYFRLFKFSVWEVLISVLYRHMHVIFKYDYVNYFNIYLDIVLCLNIFKNIYLYDGI